MECLREELVEWLASVSIVVAPCRLPLIVVFEEDLYQTNLTRNLTRVPREEFWVRHIADSLLFHDLLPDDASVLDVGSGPGLPAWPLAWARPDLKVTALDSSNKMLEFLREHPLPNLEVVLGRAEDWGASERFDVVTGRALAPLSIQLELSAQACKVGGIVLPMRTPSDLPEIKGREFGVLGLQWERTEIRRLPEFGAERVFPVYRKLRPTPSRFPRPWGEIKKAPI